MHDMTAEKMHEAFVSGRTLAERHLKPGVRFMGAMQLADALGYHRESPEHHMATQGAIVHYNQHVITTRMHGHSTIVCEVMPKIKLTSR